MSDVMEMWKELEKLRAREEWSLDDARRFNELRFRLNLTERIESADCANSPSHYSSTSNLTERIESYE